MIRVAVLDRGLQRVCKPNLRIQVEAISRRTACGTFSAYDGSAVEAMGK
jgi:hypothetical protein